MDKTTHTPLPWRLYQNDEEGLHLMGNGEPDAEDTIICERINSPEDAALLETAVNYHERMVEALRSCVGQIREMDAIDVQSTVEREARAILAELEAK